MQVDEAGNQRVVRQLDALRRLVGASRFRGGENRDDAAAGDGDAVIGERGSRRFDRDDPARADE